MKRTFVMIATLVVVAACVSTNAAVLDKTVKLPPICPDGVAMFTTADKVGQDYREIAILNSKGEATWTDESDMYKSQRKKAASLGANGIIVTNINEPKPGTKIIAAVVGVGVDRKGSSVAIHIPADTQRVRIACTGQ